MTKLFNFDPYNDDFDEDKNFMRLLFRPGYALQARELTQLQTILSSQIEKFGNHIFQNGSPITGGKISLDDRANYVILETQYSGADISLDLFLNTTVVSYNSSKNVRAKVIAIDNNTNTTPVMIVKYLSGDRFAETDEVKVVGQNLFAQVRANDAVGRSYVASIQEGVYFFKGQFVKVVPEFLVLEPFYRVGNNSTVINKQPSYKIGIEFDELVIDEVDDASLLDPAQGSFNYQAPGATRFKVDTRLSKRTLDSADESSFFEVIRLVNGVKTKEIDYPIYSELEKTLARRTFEESGNYTVDPFVLSLQEEWQDPANNNTVNADYFSAVLDPGKAYVGGYEFQTIAPTVLGIPRARDTSNVSDYDVPTSYGSYVFVKNVSKTLDITSFPQLDIHCVSAEKIDTSSTPKYDSTKIGTLRANMLKYDDATSRVDGLTHVHRMHVFQVNTTSIIGTTAASASTNTVVKLPTSFTTNGGINAYANMYFRITDGAGLAVAPILIESSNNANLTITLQSALPFIPASNAFSIDADFYRAEGFSVKSGTSLTFSANVDSSSKDTNGFSLITEKSRENAVFDLPFEAIKQGTIDNFDFYATKLYSNKVSNLGGTISFAPNGTDTFAFAGTAGVLGQTTILNNIICFVRPETNANNQFGIYPNTILSLANSNFTVTAAGDGSLTFDVRVPATYVDFLIKTKVNNAEAGATGAIRSKTLRPSLTAAEDLHVKVPYNLKPGGTDLERLTSSNTGTVTTFTGGYVFETVGATFFDTTSAMADLKTPGKAVSLQVPDIFEIVRITDSRTNTTNVTTAMLTSDDHDVTSHYEFDNGQRRTHYDHATIRLKRGYSSPIGSTLLVQYKYYAHGLSPQNSGLFTVDSYPGDYADIPLFNDKEGNRLISARGFLDFRPTRAIAGTTIANGVNADPDEVAELSFEHYLSRIDQIVVKPSKEIGVIQGQPGVKPVQPTVSGDDMLIYTLYIPPYTDDVKLIRADFKNNRRFTMSDIGAFENRIKGLEYYVALNALEKNANDSKVLDANGLERSKYGILVDNFTSTDVQASYSDVSFDNRCLVENGELKPASLMRTFKLDFDESASSGNYAAVGVADKKTLMLAYSTTEMVKQPYATKTVPVAGAIFGNFNGKMKLFPEFTMESDIDKTARVTLNSVQGLENAFNFVNEAFQFISDANPTWTNDANNPFAKVVDSKWFETVSTVTNQTVGLGGNVFGNQQITTDRVYVSKGATLSQQQFGVSTSETKIGDFVTDVSINPYLKPRAITFISNALRPFTRFYSFFDGTSIDNFIVIPNKVYLGANTEFSDGEVALLANNTGELATQLNSWLAGGTAFNLVRIVNSIPGTNTVSIVNETGLALTGKYLRGLTSSKEGFISTLVEHKSGITRALTSNTITLASDAPSVNIAGNTIYFIHEASTEEGRGSSYIITNYNTTTKVANISGTLSTTDAASSSWIYSIGTNITNKHGDIAGTFYPPAATFRTGERKLRLTESFNNTYDLDSISFSEKTFVSSGVTVNKTTLMDTVYNIDVGVKVVGTATSAILQSTASESRITSTWRVDPLAQTFFVDPSVYPNGLTLSSVNVFFSSKDNDLPVSVQIRPTVNGLPSSDFWYPESVVVKNPNDVTVTSTPDTDDLSTSTEFTFSSPVFLKPGLYALVILCDTPDYIVWTAEKGQTTTSGQYVSINPYVGTLYKSQNSMEYVPYINEDLMFVLNRCVFTTDPANFVLRTPNFGRKYNIDKFRLLDKGISLLSNEAFSTSYSFISKPVDSAKETVYRAIEPRVTYFMSDDTKYAIGFRRKEIQNSGDFMVKYQISTNDPAVSPMVSLEAMHLNAWENFIDNAEINEEDFNIISPGSGYANSNVVTITSTTGSGALVYLNVNPSGNVLGLNVAASGTGYLDDFSISVPVTASNASIVLNSEYDSSGGPCLARYITKPITLADGFDAGDIRIFLSANKPTGTEVTVFAKILSSSDSTPFKDRGYQKLECFNPTNFATTKENEFIEYEYRPSLTEDKITYTADNGIVYDNFKTFSIKIVMTSIDPSVIPRVKDLRIIALPAG